MLVSEVLGFDGALSADQQKARQIKQRQERLAADKRNLQLKKLRQREHDLLAKQRAARIAHKP